MPHPTSRTTYLPAASWIAAIVFGVLLVWLGVVAFDKASVFEGRAGYAFTGRYKEKKSFPYHVAKRYHDSLGRWGCAAVFAVPGAALIGFGVWDLRRRWR